MARPAGPSILSRLVQRCELLDLLGTVPETRAMWRTLVLQDFRRHL